MAATTKTPYELLGAVKTDNDYELRLAYRARIHEYVADRKTKARARRITDEEFQLICRAYEALSDHDKRKLYDERQQWVSSIPKDKYTLQQLAAEPALCEALKRRLKNATLATINAQDPVTGHTPLYCAARSCNSEAVYYLTENGAEPDLPQRTGSTALHVCAFYGHPEAVRCLLESGADYRKTNSGKSTAEDESYDDSVREAFTSMKQTPYVQAAADALDWLKKNKSTMGYHIDEQYYAQRQTLLHCASKKGYLGLVRWLVSECNANVDIVDVNLNSALHLAAYGGHNDIVEYLLRNGANPLLLNRWCMTAEQEGTIRGKKIQSIFQSMRSQDPFQMAADGIDWWFEYYFGDTSPDKVDSKNVSILYKAARSGRLSVVRWLLEKGANVNIQIEGGSQSTSLHGAVFGGHIAVVDELLAHGADINLKNKFGSTAFEDAQTEEMKEHLKKYRRSLEGNKFFAVHLYGDGAKSGNEALAKLQLGFDATYNDVISALPEKMKSTYTDFSMARHPFDFDNDSTFLDALYSARYVSSRFFQLPLCVTAHERARYKRAGHSLRKHLEPLATRPIVSEFKSKCKTEKLTIQGNINTKQTFQVADMSFSFPPNCATDTVVIEVNYIVNPGSIIFDLPECTCLFETQYDSRTKLEAMPTVSRGSSLNDRLYTWIRPLPYWYSQRARQATLAKIGDTHAFIHHVDVMNLILAPDMFIRNPINKDILHDRKSPLPCEALKIREHNKTEFPHIAYHGTNAAVIESILMDGLVMPSTVVSTGKRVVPPSNHISRGVSAFGIADFSNGIFVTPSIFYCSDPAYAVTFTHGDRCLIAILEVAVKDGRFGKFPCTVPTYAAHPGDNLQEIEWRLDNTADLEIISVLFIPVVQSKSKEAKLRADKLATIASPNASS